MANALSSMSNNPVQPAPIPIPPTPAETHQAEQRAEAWLQQHEDVPQLLSRKHLSLGKITALLFLVVTLPLSVWLVSQQQQLAELRSQAKTTTQLVLPESTPLLEDISDKQTPKGIAFDIYFKMYGAAVDKQWQVADQRSGVTGKVYVKYILETDESIVFSRWEKLASPKGTLPELWLKQGQEYQRAGVIDFETEGQFQIGYGAYSLSGDVMSFDSFILTYEPTDKLAKQPTQPVVVIDIKQEGNASE